MSSVALNKTYSEPIICQKEILRYAGCKKADSETDSLLNFCINEVKDKLTYKVCYREFPLKVKGDVCNFGSFELKSEKLALNLVDSEKAIIFAATIGVEIDRLIAKYGRISPSKALMLQAIGAERIEALCDTFCAELAMETGLFLTPRFSPGYGDLPLESQKEIFSLLDCSRRIGLTLNNSMLMSPSKSVTAIVGLGGKKKLLKNKCSNCTKKDCAYRGAL